MTQEPMIMISSSYLTIALMLSLQVYIGLRTVLFGIVLPAEALQDPAVRAIHRNYALLTSGLRPSSEDFAFYGCTISLRGISCTEYHCFRLL